MKPVAPLSPALAVSALLCAPLYLATLLLGACGSTPPAEDGPPQRFRVTLANVAEPVLIDGEESLPTFAPGLWVVHAQGTKPLFSSGEADRDEGLEALAEDGDPTALLATLRQAEVALDVDGFDLPPSEYVAGVLRPGSSFVFEVELRPSERLSFAGMYAQSNDVFLATPEDGLNLFDAEGQPRAGDLTHEIALWDTGTEVNQEPGKGPDQGARQAAPNTGTDENGVVRPLDDGFSYAQPFVTVTIEPLD